MELTGQETANRAEDYLFEDKVFSTVLVGRERELLQRGSAYESLSKNLVTNRIKHTYFTEYGCFLVHFRLFQYVFLDIIDQIVRISYQIVKSIKIRK